MSGVETIKHPEVLKTARPDAKQRKDFVKTVKKIASSDRPYSVMGPSVLFTLPDPDKVTDKHFIKQWGLQTIRIDLGRLLKDYPDTVVWGVELLPYDYAWREMSDEEFEEEIAALGFSSWEEFRDERSRPLGLDEVYDFTLTDPVELWAHYPKSDIGKKYASNVPHAFIITPMGYIPYKYIEYVDEARSNPSEDGPEMLEDIDIVIDYYRDCGVYGFGGQCVLAAEIVFDEVTDFGNLNFPDRLEIVAVWHTFSLTVLKQPRGHVCLRYFIGGDRKSPEAYVYIDSDLQEKEYVSIESWGHVDLETMQSELDLDDDPRLENYGDKEEFGTTTLSFANLDEFKASPSYRMFCKNTTHNDDVDGSRSNPTDDHIKIKFSFSALLRYFEFVNEYKFYDEVDIVSADFLFAEFAQHITLYRVLDQREMYFISTEGDFGGGRFNTEIERATGAAFAATSIQDVVEWGRAWRERGRLVGDLYVLEVDGFKRVFSSLRSPEDTGIDVSGLNDALNAYRKGSISAEEGIERCGLLDREYSVPRSSLCTTGLGCSIRLKEWDQFKVYKVIGDGVQEIDGIPIDVELPKSEPNSFLPPKALELHAHECEIGEILRWMCVETCTPLLKDGDRLFGYLADLYEAPTADEEDSIVREDISRCIDILNTYSVEIANLFVSLRLAENTICILSAEEGSDLLGKRIADFNLSTEMETNAVVIYCDALYSRLAHSAYGMERELLITLAHELGHVHGGEFLDEDGDVVEVWDNHGPDEIEVERFGVAWADAVLNGLNSSDVRSIVNDFMSEISQLKEAFTEGRLDPYKRIETSSNPTQETKKCR